MLGLKRGIVKLIPHQKEWQAEFIKEKEFLHSLLGDTISIEHVGSTAVEGLLAKPILDIAIGLTSETQEESIFKILSENGYEDRGDDGVLGENLLVKGDESNRTHYIHIVKINSPAWNNYIALRDYLRTHKTAREEYTHLKLELAKKYPKNRKAYTDGKSDFIETTLKKSYL